MMVTTTSTVEGNKLLRHGDYYKKKVVKNDLLKVRG